MHCLPPSCFPSCHQLPTRLFLSFCHGRHLTLSVSTPELMIFLGSRLLLLSSPMIGTPTPTQVPGFSQTACSGPAPSLAQWNSFWGPFHPSFHTGRPCRHMQSDRDTARGQTPQWLPCLLTFPLIPPLLPTPQSLLRHPLSISGPLHFLPVLSCPLAVSALFFNSHFGLQLHPEIFP